MGVVRTSSVTCEGRRALSDFQNAALPIEDRLVLIVLACCRAPLGVKQATVENDLARCFLASGWSGN